ncbi:MAG TPA: MHYT domain-containing protein [Methylomirabilota bacterium]|nr:MHYT domain-containing protein [Methylomirabilota bacterium]
MIQAAHLHGSYDPILVTLSVAIAIFASFTALDLAGRMNAAGKQGRTFWLVAAATALGGGIWSMHFVAMLAFDLGPMAINYDAGSTIASLAAAILVVGIGLHIVNHWPRRWGALIAAGTVTGLGVAIMHYTGMAAMQMHADAHYDPLIVGISITIAVVAATVALFLATYLTATWHRVASAFVMGAAIATMHYTGMAAVQFTTAEGPMTVTAAAIPPQILALLIGGATVIVLVLGLVAALIDRRLAYQAQMDEAARQNEASKFRALVTNIPGACYRCANDAAYTMEFISDAIENISGYPASDFIGNRVRTYSSLFHPDDTAHVDKIVGDAVARREPFTIEYRVQHKDGVYRWVHEKGLGIFDGDGKLLHLDGVIFDITDRRKMEEELRQTLADLHNATDRLAVQERFATIGQVAATVSHELRNPLGAIRNSMGVVRQVVGKERPAVERALDRADRNVDRCAKIIYDLLAFTQKREMKREPMAIDAGVAQALDKVPPIEGIAVERDFRCRDEVAVDREGLQQVVQKLVENAAQALQDPAWQRPAGHERRIVVRTEAAGPLVRLSIADNGPGIPADILSKVFEPLFTTKSFGVGLGLPTVRQIVEQHGGTIDVESAVDEGTTFIVWLPRRTAGESTPKAAA